MDKIVAIKGMNDILPNESHNWLWLEQVIKDWLISYGYENIRTPIVEATGLFIRSIGEVTDIVEKEMYTFTDSLNGDSLTLRPEGTAGTLRAVVEHNLLYNATCKLWYIGSMFRHERPQKGRYRQFHQLGVEALGFNNAIIDSEIILMQQDLWNRLGLAEHLKLEINCLGDKEERELHRKALIKYFESNITLLDLDAKNRLYKNPLRILDTKNPTMQNLASNAPRLSDYLSANSLEHHNQWKKNLTALGIQFSENHRLVRGLDYYNLSVFEWVTDKLGAQATVSAGGRYDRLIKQLSGKENYAIGFATGLERLLLLINQVSRVPTKNVPDIYIVTSGENSDIYAMNLAHLLRTQGYLVVQDLTNASFKSQLKKADNLKCKLSFIIGENEVANKQVMVKFMDGQNQELVQLTNIVEYLTHKLK
ncbi:MAG: histidine--tRNA ligase [Burkholderiales bacterium]|nr:histidine--tRNA ligase [Burkholderiales bacterium]